MSDTVELKLPISEKVVVLRNYTTRGDDERAESVLYAGVLATNKGGSNKQEIEFPIANVMASQKSYVPRLVQSIDGDTTDLANRISDLRTEDYAAIEEAVDRIVEEHSPKVNAGKKNSKPASTES